MNVSEQEFKFMVEGIVADLVQLTMDRKNYSLAHAVEEVYNSKIYAALQRPTSRLYTQSSGYVYTLLEKELNEK